VVVGVVILLLVMMIGVLEWALGISAVQVAAIVVAVGCIVRLAVCAIVRSRGVGISSISRGNNVVPCKGPWTCSGRKVLTVGIGIHNLRRGRR
jgi:hypothetical protein